MTNVSYYDVELTQIVPHPAKRQILSVIAKFFNLLCWTGPIVIVAKILMRELWELFSKNSTVYFRTQDS